ncbi:chemotaxis protein CheB [Dactylosporangium sp. NPDC050688]|uniref:chemotaxis protein CheB n=1 Tax=Dactylosporangium sp. NPDC050688 TaxID=3157217 RepID=UPI0033FFF445
MDTFRRDIVVIGGSAGGHDAARRLVARLPAGLEAAVLVALHLAPTARSTLGDILARAGRLPAGDLGEAIAERAVATARLLVARARALHGPRLRT